MLYQPKTSRLEHSEATVLIVWNLHKAGFSAPKIQLVTRLPKSTVTFDIRRFKNSQNHEYKKTIRTDRPRKLNQRAQRHLVRSLNQDPFATLATLSTPQSPAIVFMVIPFANIWQRTSTMHFVCAGSHT